MAERGRPKAPLVLTEEERQTLERWARRSKTSQALALRCKIVLACAEGATNKAVAEQLGIWPQTVTKWRGRFVRQRLEGLSDEDRPGRPRTITDDQVEQVITKTLEEPPPNHDTHWSTRSMARATGMSQTAISRIWRAFGLKPHLQETWKLSTDPQFIDKVRDVVGLYLDPPEAALVLCVDEKSQIQALDRTAPSLPILPTELDVHLICDNYGTHKTPEIKRWFLRHPRFQLHLTPTYSSWLNLVERWFAELTNRKLRRSAHRSVAELEADLRIWIEAWNQDPRPFVWTKTADEILDNLARYLHLINNSRH